MRVRALLRRANIEMERKLTIGNLVLDADAMTAEIDGEEIPVATREFNILYKLLSYPKKTFTRAQLMDEFWGMDTDTSLRAVDVYITKIRDKFSTCDGFEDQDSKGTWIMKKSRVVIMETGSGRGIRESRRNFPIRFLLFPLYFLQ